MTIVKQPTKPPSYFEAVMQLRGCGQEVCDFVEAFVAKERDPDHFVSKIEKVKTGIDVYLSDNKLAVKVASHIMKRFGGRAQTSSRLFGKSRVTSKNLMRLSVVYRGLDFGVGAVLALPVKRTVVRVRKLGHNVQVTDLRSGKMTGFYPHRTHYRLLEKHKSRVIRVRPTIQVLDPETYQPVDVKNSPDVHVNQEVVITDWLGWWIVK